MGYNMYKISFRDGGMMIKIALVDDESQIRNQLTGYIEKYKETNNLKCTIEHFSDAYDLVDDYKKSFDIIFMDIQMSKMDGMTAANLIRQVDQEVVLVFVTNMANYAIEGYKVDALSYIVKPIMYYDFVQQLDKVIAKIEREQKSYLMVSSQSDITRVDVSEIIYIESVEHKIVIHMIDEELTINSSLKIIEKDLVGKSFFRCHSGYLINLRHVEGISNNEVQIANIRLAISRGKKKAFMTALSEYIGG